MAFDIALKIKAKNGILQSFIDEMGWTQAEFARRIGTQPSEVGDWFNMRGYPRTAKRMLVVAELIGKLPEEIFPQIMMDKDWLTGEREWIVHKEVDLEQCFPLHHMKSLEAPADDVDGFALKEGIQSMLSTLTPRQEKVIKMRLGFDGGDGMTLEEVGEEFGLSRTKIRQIEVKALRKMRNPARRKILSDFVEGEKRESIY